MLARRRPGADPSATRPCRTPTGDRSRAVSARVLRRSLPQSPVARWRVPDDPPLRRQVGYSAPALRLRGRIAVVVAARAQVVVVARDVAGAVVRAEPVAPRHAGASPMTTHLSSHTHPVFRRSLPAIPQPRRRQRCPDAASVCSDGAAPARSQCADAPAVEVERDTSRSRGDTVTSGRRSSHGRTRAAFPPKPAQDARSPVQATTAAMTRLVARRPSTQRSCRGGVYPR